MSLVNEYITVGLNSSVISYYEKLGYKIPRSRDNEGRLRVPKGTTINIKTIDLPHSSNQIVEVECDYCKKHKNIQYDKYNKNVKNNNGIYLCSIDIDHRDFFNGISYEKIIDCIKQFYNKTGKFPRYDEYTKENGIPFSYTKIVEFLKRHGTSLNDELAKIDCHNLRKVNIEYYDEYLQRLKEVIKKNPKIGNDLYSLSRDNNCKVFGLPNIRWFIEHCPDKSVNNIDTFKEWAGFYTKHLSKEQCAKIIIDTANKLDRPLKYDDFRGHEYGQVTIQMIRDHWGSLNKMKEELGLEVIQENMVDKQLSKENFDDCVNYIIDFLSRGNRNFITTREINEMVNFPTYGTLDRMCKKYYNIGIVDYLSSFEISFGKQGRGLNYNFEDGEHVTSQFEYMFSKFLKDYGLQYNIDYFRDVKYSSFIPEYKNNMNCDYVIHINNKIIYIEIAGILAEYKPWFYQDKLIQKSKSKEKYRTKLKQKEEMLKSNNLLYFILFPCDLTKENFVKILEDGSITLKKEIESFHQNNIDWVKIRNTTGELDYSKDVVRKEFKKKEKEVG